MSDRNYSNTATEAALVGSITAADTSFTLASFGGYPATPFTAVIDRNTALEEIVLVTSVSVDTIVCTRGYDNTTAKSHDAGAQFLHVVAAIDYDEANTHINASSNVHGVTGSVVGTSDTQTLSNKTLTTPTISGPTISGTAAMGSVTLSGTLGVTGNTSLSTLSTTGNTNLGGTLGVVGAISGSSASLTGALAVGGATTFTGTVTVPTPSVAGHAVTKAYADALGTATSTADTIMRRDGSGNTAIDTITIADTPTANNHGTRKDYVDTTATSTANARIAAKLQAGSASIALTAANQDTGNVTFPTAFSSAPKVVITPHVAGGSGVDLTAVLTAVPTTTGFSWRVRERAGSNVTITGNLHWIAMVP
jgi:hypothetical protein